MTGKQLIDLTSTDSFSEGDLMLVSKSAMGGDRKITYGNFLESIGNPAINGYTASLDDNQENKIILKAANNVPVYKYCQGMKISFKAPAKTSGVVQVKIGDLEYKNLYHHKDSNDIRLEKDAYIEAVLANNHFYQVNDFKPFTGTKLEGTNSFSEDDLLLVRKHGTKVDKIISHADFLESIGSSAISGYIATLDNSQENKIILKAANNAFIPKYYEGMRVSFRVPAKTTGIVKVKIGKLKYKHLYNHKTNISVSLDKDDYVEAIFTGEHFYQVNDFKKVPTIYTNDYICVAYEKPSNGVSTDLTLATAYGLYKQEYYNSMSINFMCPIDTQGAVRVNIDGLGLKNVIENDEVIYTPLHKGQIVHAVFNGESFVRNGFKFENPKIRPSLEPSITSSPEENPQPVIPLENILEFNVGKGLIGCNINFHFSTLREALEEILSKYSDNSGRKVTLNILSELTTSKDSVVIENRDLSWITLKGNPKNQIKIFFNKESNHRNRAFFSLTSCKNFNFAKDAVITVALQELDSSFDFFLLEDCNFSMQNVTMDFINFTPRGNDSSAFYIVGGSVIMNRIISKGFLKNFHIVGGKKSITSLTDCKFNNCIGHNVILYSSNCEFNITNCDLSKITGKNDSADIHATTFATITQINSKATATYLGLNGFCCPPNTTGSYIRYIVTGSQDKVGTDN